jgi:hypothetical protein
MIYYIRLISKHHSLLFAPRHINIKLEGESESVLFAKTSSVLDTLKPVTKWSYHLAF